MKAVILDFPGDSEDYLGLSNYFLALIDAHLEERLNSGALVEPLASAVHHSIFPRGKRIRPLLALMLCHDLGGDVKQLIPVASSLELVHTASLIHDDLPALDDDDTRRGRPTVHKAYSEATAILAGDALVPFAIGEISRSGFIDSEKGQLISILSKSYIDVCSGQQLDLLPPGQRGDLQSIHRLKTGSLFLASTSFGVIAAGGNAKQLHAAQELGLWIGLGFQVVDDLIDAYGQDEDRGRAGSSDGRNEKETFASPGKLSDELELAQNGVQRCLDEIDSENKFAATSGVIDLIFSRAKPLLERANNS